MNCRHCGQPVVLVELDATDWHWTHTGTGYFTCGLHAWVTGGMQGGYQQDMGLNLAEPGGTKSTTCAGGCCYNAVKDECVNYDCECHTQPAFIVIQEINVCDRCSMPVTLTDLGWAHSEAADGIVCALLSV